MPPVDDFVLRLKIFTLESLLANYNKNYYYVNKEYIAEMWEIRKHK